MRIDSTNTITTMTWENEPVAVVDAGEVLTVKTLDCFSNKITSANLLLKDVPWNEVNPATGPIYVNGAEKGDALRISILDIRTENRAAILCESSDLQLYECNGNGKTLFADVLNGNVHISDQIVISQAPMIGVLGTAPESGNIPTTLPGVHGGNMDNTHITIGSVVYLPVFHKGALLALGDLHAAMGDGESTGSGFEVGGEVTLKIEVVKQCDFPLPMVRTGRVIETVASASSLDVASILAVKNMIRYLTKNLDVEMDTAWKLVAACGDVGICQFANEIKTVRCSLPIKYLPSVGRSKASQAQHDSFIESEDKRSKEPFDFEKFAKYYLHDRGSCQSLSPNESQGVKDQYERRYYDHPEIMTVVDFANYLDEMDSYS